MPRILVIKLGTSLVTNADGTPDRAVLSDVARQVALLWQERRRVAIVSSGAVGVGSAALKFRRRPRDLSKVQAAAAAGQPRLMAAWAAAFEPFNLGVGQVLLTREDADDRGRFLNMRNTVTALWQARAVPIVNENDTVSTAELRGGSAGGGAGGGAGAGTFGDNDKLAAVVASALSAEMLVLLSTVAGLLDADGQVVPSVSDVAAVAALIRTGTSAGGTGGMASKLAAASLVMRAGETMVLADGRSKDALLRAVHNEAGGTRFLPQTDDRLTGRSRWITTARAAGRLTLDEGAARAIRGGRASLLPAGVVAAAGEFVRGDVVELLDRTGTVLARGLTNYDVDLVRRIAGRQSRELPDLIDPPYHEEIVHRDYIIHTTPTTPTTPTTTPASNASLPSLP